MKDDFCRINYEYGRMAALQSLPYKTCGKEVVIFLN